MNRAQYIGTYRVISLVARGGQAEVFLAMSRAPADFGRIVVIKRLEAASTAIATSKFAVEMFLDEADLATRLRHPNVVETYETGQVDGDHYIVMEHLDGQTLSRIRKAIPGVAPEIWAWIIAEALAGLDHVHTACDHDGTRLEIVHGDVSPQNLFVTYDGRVKVIDFGVARSIRSRWPTELGMLTGKLRYMAPEQALAREEARSDVFAMGAILWEAIAQRRLFRGERAEVLDALFAGRIPGLAAVVPNVDPELDWIVARALARAPSARFESARAMREALLSFVGRSGRPMGPEVIARLLDAPFRPAREQKRMLLDTAARIAHADAEDTQDAPGRQSAPQSLRTEPASLAPRVLATVPPAPSPRPFALPRWTALAAGAAAAIAVAFTLQILATASHRRAASAASLRARSPRTATETLSPRSVAAR